MIDRPLSERVRESYWEIKIDGTGQLNGDVIADEIAALEAERDEILSLASKTEEARLALEAECERLERACRSVVAAYDSRGVFRGTYDEVRAALEGREP